MPKEFDYTFKQKCLDNSIVELNNVLSKNNEDKTHWYLVYTMEGLKQIKEDLHRLEGLEK